MRVQMLIGVAAVGVWIGTAAADETIMTNKGEIFILRDNGTWKKMDHPLRCQGDYLVLTHHYRRHEFSNDVKNIMKTPTKVCVIADFANWDSYLSFKFITRDEGDIKRGLHNDFTFGDGRIGYGNLPLEQRMVIVDNCEKNFCRAVIYGVTSREYNASLAIEAERMEVFSVQGPEGH